jgi:hypothetical protein
MFHLGPTMVMSRSDMSRVALFRRLVLVLATLQVLALLALYLSLDESSKSREFGGPAAARWERYAASVLWALGGVWAAGWWAAVQCRRARIALGFADPHRLEDALEVIAAAALAPVAAALIILGSVASME